jgi:hypothetical protein
MSLEEKIGKLVDEILKRDEEQITTIPGYSLHYVLSLTDEEIRKIVEEFGVLAIDRVYADIYMNASFQFGNWEERIRSAIWECFVKRLEKLGVRLEKVTERYIIFTSGQEHPIRGKTVKIKTMM